MHRVIHFGSVLQAYALQKFLLNNGLDNEIIDYVYPNKWHKNTTRKSFRAFIIETVYRVIKWFDNKTEKQKSPIALFIEKELIKSNKSYSHPRKLKKNCPKYDIYLTGSDQVWNTDYLKGDTSFFCSFVNNESQKLSYAASFGRFTFEGNEAKCWLSNLLTYKALSVREKKAQDIIKQYTGLDAELVADPTLLLSKNDWAEFSDIPQLINGKYILIYVLTYAWDPFPYVLDVIKHFEKKLGWEIVVVEPLSLKLKNPSWRYIDNINPHQFVNLIRNAGLVLTTSFHGTAFSINLEVPFYAIINKSKANDDRIKSLCEMIDVREGLLMENSDLPEFPNIDFRKSTHNLNIIRKHSSNFLLNAILKNAQ